MTLTDLGERRVRSSSSSAASSCTPLLKKKAKRSCPEKEKPLTSEVALCSETEVPEVRSKFPKTINIATAENERLICRVEEAVMGVMGAGSWWMDAEKRKAAILQQDYVSLVWVSDAVKWGVQAECEIPADTLFMWYKADAIPELSEAEFVNHPKKLYMIHVQGWVDIVGEGEVDKLGGPWEFGSLANHSCSEREVNCRPVEFGNGLETQIGFYSTRLIKKGDPVLWNYGRNYVKEFLKECLCTLCVGRRLRLKNFHKPFGVHRKKRGGKKGGQATIGTQCNLLEDDCGGVTVETAVAVLSPVPPPPWRAAAPMTDCPIPEFALTPIALDAAVLAAMTAFHAMSLVLGVGSLETEEVVREVVREETENVAPREFPVFGPCIPEKPDAASRFVPEGGVAESTIARVFAQRHTDRTGQHGVEGTRLMDLVDVEWTRGMLILLVRMARQQVQRGGLATLGSGLKLLVETFPVLDGKDVETVYKEMMKSREYGRMRAAWIRGESWACVALEAWLGFVVVEVAEEDAFSTGDPESDDSVVSVSGSDEEDGVSFQYHIRDGGMTARKVASDFGVDLEKLLELNVGVLAFVDQEVEIGTCVQVPWDICMLPRKTMRLPPSFGKQVVVEHTIGRVFGRLHEQRTGQWMHGVDLGMLENVQGCRGYFLALVVIAREVMHSERGRGAFACDIEVFNLLFSRTAPGLFGGEILCSGDLLKMYEQLVNSERFQWFAALWLEEKGGGLEDFFAFLSEPWGAVFALG